MSAPVAAAAHAGARERDKTAEQKAPPDVIDADWDRLRRAVGITPPIPGTPEWWKTTDAAARHAWLTEQPLGLTLSSTPVVDYGALGNITITPTTTVASTYYNAAELTGPHHPHAG